MNRWYLAAIAALVSAAPATARWREASSQHFVVYSEASASDLKGYAEKLERYDATLRLLTGRDNPLPGNAARVTVYQLRSIADVQAVFGNGGKIGVAGFYIPYAEGSVAFVPERGEGNSVNDFGSDAILFHEYAHHFMFFNFPGSYPGWYTEGFAEFAGQTKIGKDGSVTIGSAPMYRQWGFAGGALPVSQIVTSKLSYNPIDGDEFYARSWQLVHYLSFAPERKGQLDTYLRAVAGGVPRPKAATDAFGDLKKLDRDASIYIGGRNLPGLRLGPDSTPIGTVTVRELSDGANAMLPIRIASKRGVARPAAIKLEPRARAVAATYPADPMVQTALAEAEIDAGYLPQAIAAADRALAVDPRNVAALVIRGRALMQQAIAAKASDEATWSPIRRTFVTANRADPTHPDPLYYNYRTFIEAGQPPSRNAIIGLVEAVRVAPQAREQRLDLVRQYLVDKNLPAARTTLEPFSNDNERSKGTKWGTVWTALDANDAEAAVKAIDAAAAVKPETDK